MQLQILHAKYTVTSNHNYRFYINFNNKLLYYCCNIESANSLENNAQKWNHAIVLKYLYMSCK